MTDTNTNLLLKLSELWEYILTCSPLPPYLNGKLFELFKHHYDEKTILTTLNISDVENVVYSQNTTGVEYATVAGANVSHGYIYLLIPSEDYEISQAIKELVQFYVTSKRYSSNEEIGETIKIIHKFKHDLEWLLKVTVRSRRGKHNNENQNQTQEYVFPPVPVLQEFYECGRKKKYSSKPNTLRDNRKDFYVCHWCGEYHLGSPKQAGVVVPEQVAIGRWKTAWRRYENKRISPSQL